MKRVLVPLRTVRFVGAVDDIEKATHLARLIIMQLGMNPKVGLVNLKRTRQNPQDPYQFFSDATAQVRRPVHARLPGAVENAISDTHALSLTLAFVEESCEFISMPLALERLPR